jgi:hypothetical protein
MVRHRGASRYTTDAQAGGWECAINFETSMDVVVYKMENQFDTSHIAGHILSVLAIIASWIGLLPGIASLAAICWYALQLYESKPIQRWLRNRRKRKIDKFTRVLQDLQSKQDEKN